VTVGDGVAGIAVVVFCTSALGGADCIAVGTAELQADRPKAKRIINVNP
jgi:hypothetical protein